MKNQAKVHKQRMERLPQFAVACENMSLPWQDFWLEHITDQSSHFDTTCFSSNPKNCKPIPLWFQRTLSLPDFASIRMLEFQVRQQWHYSTMHA